MKFETFEYVLSVEQIMTGTSTQQKIYWKKD